MRRAVENALPFIFLSLSWGALLKNDRVEGNSTQSVQVNNTLKSTFLNKCLQGLKIRGVGVGGFRNHKTYLAIMPKIKNEDWEKKKSLQGERQKTKK